MKKPALTILTDPIPYGQEFLAENARRLGRCVKYYFNDRPYLSGPHYRGHRAVTRSLVQGLEKINANFNYNPTQLRDVAEVVVVLAGIRTLRQAVRLKAQGIIKKLYAGPNIVILSSDYDSILAEPEVDAVITPCNWVIDLYLEDNPSLAGRIFSWPAGVDTGYWSPRPDAYRTHILIFEKQNKNPVGPIKPYVDYLHSLDWKVDILQYGTFHHDQYQKLLHQACLMVGFVSKESQGIAWAEAWAADVPTLLWRNTSDTYQGRYFQCSTAPYLCNKNGLFFDDLDDFKRQFAYWDSHRDQFIPRVWTLENMSDEVCAKLLHQKLVQC